MASVTIVLDEPLASQLQARASALGLTADAFAADAIRRRLDTDWPPDVLGLLGAIPDFPTAEEIRGSDPPDSPRDAIEAASDTPSRPS